MASETFRFATAIDVETQQKFCVVHLRAGDQGYYAKVLRKDLTISRDGSTLRFGCYGDVLRVPLGEFLMHSLSLTETTGVLIDYAENEKKLLKSAKQVLADVKAKQIQAVEAIADRMRACELCVAG